MLSTVVTPPRRVTTERDQYDSFVMPQLNIGSSRIFSAGKRVKEPGSGTALLGGHEALSISVGGGTVQQRGAGMTPAP